MYLRKARTIVSTARILGDTFEVSGIGSGGVTIRTQYDTGMVYVFSLYYDSRNDE